MKNVERKARKANRKANKENEGERKYEGEQ